MDNWVKEWRTPRSGEVVLDQDKKIGYVYSAKGSLTKKKLCIRDVNENLVEDNVDAELYTVADHNLALEFHTNRYKLKGYVVGSICMYNNNPQLPLEIVELNFNKISQKITICLRDMIRNDRSFLRTENLSLIPIFECNYPDMKSMMYDEMSGLKYRLEINLIETKRLGWTNAGSVWEFNREEDALDEIESWKQRLKIRRINSIINADWKISFPCWTIDVATKEGKDVFIVKKISSFCGYPCMFKTAAHAAYCSSLIKIEEFKSVLFLSTDVLIL